jgi:hypothetical protein
MHRFPYGRCIVHSIFIPDRYRYISIIEKEMNEKTHLETRHAFLLLSLYNTNL